MPTLTWIVETADERYYERGSDGAPAPPRVYECSLCDKHFDSPDELNRHAIGEHPLGLPALYIDGRPVLREFVVRSAVTRDRVALTQCSFCEVQVDGGPEVRFSREEFRTEFVKPRNSTWVVRLLNERRRGGRDDGRPSGGVDKGPTGSSISSLANESAAAEYRIRFRIPDSAALDAVDERFVRTLAHDRLEHADLDAFAAGLPSEAPAREYSSALGDYAVGVLLKEGRPSAGSQVGFEEFVVKMSSALEVLRWFDRPVALTVAGSITFNLNGFHDSAIANTLELAAAFRFFRVVMGVDSGSDPGSAVGQTGPGSFQHAVCPVDEVSHRLLRASGALARGSDLTVAEIEDLEYLVHGTIPISEHDLVKIHVICAEGYNRLGRKSDARPHLRAVQFDASFGGWVQTQLEGVSTDG